MGEGLELGERGGVPGPSRHVHQPRLPLVPDLGQVLAPVLTQQVTQPSELLNVQLLEPEDTLLLKSL